MNNFIARALAETFLPPQSDFGPRVGQSAITDTQSLINKIDVAVGWVFYALIAYSVVEIILAGFNFLKVGKDPKSLDTAKSRVIYAAVAVAVALFAKSVPLIVKNFIGSQL